MCKNQKGKISETLTLWDNLCLQVLRFPNTQTKETLEFFTALGLNPNNLTAAQLPQIQEKMAHRYRIVFVNYVGILFFIMNYLK